MVYQTFFPSKTINLTHANYGRTENTKQILSLEPFTRLEGLEIIGHRNIFGAFLKIRVCICDQSKVDFTTKQYASCGIENLFWSLLVLDFSKWRAFCASVFGEHVDQLAMVCCRLNSCSTLIFGGFSFRLFEF